MIKLIKWLFITGLVLGALLAIVIYGLIENEPLVDPEDKLSSIEQGHINSLLRDRIPLDVEYGQLASLNLSEMELNLIIKWFENKQDKLKINSNWTLLDESAEAQLSITLPQNPVGKYLNLSVKLIKTQQDDLAFNARQMKAGVIPLPDSIAQTLVDYAHIQLLEKVAMYRSAVGSIGRLNIRTGELDVSYRWNRKLATDLQNQFQILMMSSELQKGVTDMMRFINQQLLTSRDKVGLDEMLKLMFAEAHEQQHELSPSIENRAIFISLATLMMGYELPGIGDEFKQLRQKLNFKLYGRRDLAKHFIISAAVTSLSSEVLAEIVGLKKEMADARRGSGFSYADLAADRAGIKLAVQAAESDSKAITIQQRMMNINAEVDFMPAIEKLPEGIINNTEKAMLESSKTQDEYNNLIAQRIEQLRIYQ